MRIDSPSLHPRRSALATGLATTILILGIVSAATATTSTKLNLLVIQTDEHNFRTLGCYRDQLSPDQALIWGPDAKVETPWIDSIAERGALCTRYYATSPVCSPSRAALVSGRYPQNTPVVQNNIPLADHIVTFAELLSRDGYATGYAGKWHLDGGGKPQWAPARRFGFTDNRYMFNRGHWKDLELTDQGPRVKARDKGGRPSYGVQDADETSFATDFLADRTVEFVRAHRDEPFCYMVSLPDPHGPNSVRPPYDTMYKDMTFAPPKTMEPDGLPRPTWGRPQVEDFKPDLLRRYFGMVKCIDDNVGKILAALRDLGLMERTIVVFTSDHGDLCYEHGRHNKGVPLEASARIPFVIACPDLIPAGLVLPDAMGTVDFLPTILGLMGIATPDDIEGRSLSPLFRGERPAADASSITFVRAAGANQGPNAWLAAIDDRFKLVLSNSEQPWLLDRHSDPDERRNQAFDPALRNEVRRLARALAAYAADTRDPYVQLPNLVRDLSWAVSESGPEAYPGRAAIAAESP